MPDSYDIQQAIRQFGMARWYGIHPHAWAYSFMLSTQDAGIGLGYCFKTFEEMVNA